MEENRKPSAMESFGVFGVICLAVIVVTSVFAAGAKWRDEVIRKQMVDRGLAEYDQKTGEWRWKK